MSKLIITSADLAGGGAARVVSVLSTQLADNFDDVQIVNWDKLPVYYKFDDRIKIVDLPDLSHKNGRLNQIFAFRKYIKKEKPDVILSLLTPYNMLALLSTMFMKVPVVVSDRSDPNGGLRGGKIEKLIRDLLYQRSKGIIVQTEYAMTCYRPSLRKKASFIYNPISMSEKQLGRALQTKKEDYMVAVGRLDPLKDYDTMIQAYLKYQSKGGALKLIVYGTGIIEEEVKDEVAQYGLQDSFILAGTRDNIWDYMVCAKFFVLSSIIEGMSNALMEAMCLGLPVISTKVAGSTELIKDGENGYLVDIKDSETMSERMMTLSSDESLCEMMGKNATKIYSFLNADNITKQWVDYLKSLV